MTPGETAQILTAVAAVGAMVVSVIGAVVSFLNRGKIDGIARATDGMKTELVDEVRKASFAKGVKSAEDKSSPTEDPSR